MTDLALLSAEDLISAYSRRLLDPVQVLQAITERVARLNPQFNAFATMSKQALQQAGESAIRWRAGRPLGALDGVPVTIKDLVDVAGMPTRRGSRLTDPTPAVDDAPSVVGLKSAGAVIIGKTTTTEYGWKSPGDCPLHGITRNPWNAYHTPGGSSAGAAAACAAGFGALHLGTDAGGSIRIPAAWCGVVGLKPSFGRVPQWPLGAFANVAVAGPITRTVRDAALMLGVLARHDLRDPFSLPDAPRNWLDGIDEGVAGMRIGLMRRPGFCAPVDQESIIAFDQAAALLAKAGAVLEEVEPDLPDVRAIFSKIWSLALSRVVAGVAIERRHLLDPGLLEVAAATDGITAMDMLEAEALRIQAAHAMARLHQSYDVVLTPCVAIPAPLADQKTENPVEALWAQWAPWTFAYNLTRQPAISVPMGFDENGLPRSVQLAAALYRDDLVLKAARAIEMAQPFEMPDFG